MPLRLALFSLIVLFATLARGESHTGACLIESADELPAIRLCQQNISIPASLFAAGFCQPEIPDRVLQVEMLDACPQGAYGKCEGAQTSGVGYRQSIFYYSEEDDAPVLAAYCEQISNGRWIELETSE